MTDFPPPASPQALQYSSQPELPKGMAIASMVCGICSIPFLCIWYLAIPAAIVAVVLGFIARAKAKRGEAAGSGMATAGILGFSDEQPSCGSTGSCVVGNISTTLRGGEVVEFIALGATSRGWIAGTPYPRPPLEAFRSKKKTPLGFSGRVCAV
jgi:hypothetical protein